MTVALTLVQILAMTMFGEAHILKDKDAALAVGHVFMNRLDVGLWWGTTPLQIVTGFNAFVGVELESVPEEYFGWAQEVIDNPDFTGGCLFIMSHQDGLATAGEHAIGVRAVSEWKSVTRVIDGRMYRLYGYRKYPNFDNYPYGPCVIVGAFMDAQRLLEQWPQEHDIGH